MRSKIHMMLYTLHRLYPDDKIEKVRRVCMMLMMTFIDDFSALCTMKDIISSSKL